jgi:membrane protease YdiL (CAAX protease family)
MKNPLAKAVLGGATISLIPSILITRIAELFPSLAPDELQIVSDFFGNGVGLWQWLAMSIIVFVMPVIEEVIFRGWLWRLCKWRLNSYWTWVITSLVFAAVHAEPLHILGLLPLSFFLGWLRKETDDIGYSTVAHVTNNAVACLLMII